MRVERPFRVGVIGAGYVGTGKDSKKYQSMGCKHVRDYLAAGAQVVAACGLDAEDGERLRAEFGPMDYTTDYRELLARPEIEVVSIATPDHWHFKHCAAALLAGKHVLCEKPMVTKLEHARELVRLVRQTGLKFMVGNLNRYVPALKLVLEMTQQGDIGRPFLIEATYWHHMTEQYAQTPWRVDRPHPQDFWIGGGVHPMDLALAVGGKVETVSAMSNRLCGLDLPLDDHFAVLVRFRSGTIARISAAAGIHYLPHCITHLHIFGNQGTLLADNQSSEVKFLSAGASGDPVDWTRFPVKATDVHAQKPVRAEIEHLFQCIREDCTPVVDVVSGFHTTAALVAVLRSCQSGRCEPPAQLE